MGKELQVKSLGRLTKREKLILSDRIIEAVVYDGAIKVWRVLNVLTGTVYSTQYDTKEDARASIKDGEIRSGKTVVGCYYNQLSLF